MGFLKKGGPSIALFLGIVLWGSWFLYVKDYGTWGGNFDFGKWGDSFGVINSLVSLLTLILVGTTFYNQKTELREQSESIVRQDFGNTYSLLLKTAQEHFSNIQVIDSEDETIGLEIPSFSPYNKKDKINYSLLKGGLAIKFLTQCDNLPKHINNGTLESFEKYINTLGVLERFIESATDGIDKKFYINLTKTQINQSEKKVYHALYKESKKIAQLKFLMD